VNNSVNKLLGFPFGAYCPLETQYDPSVSLWIRVRGKFSQPLYQDNKQTRLKPQDGEYYLRCAGKWYPVGNDPLLALDAKAAKEKLLRAVERGTVPESEALPHLNPPANEARLSVGAASTYLTTGRRHKRTGASIPCSATRWH
jgi:hypothetical protein